MRLFRKLLISLSALATTAWGGVRIDEGAFGESLGGWQKRGQEAADYRLSGTTYRTYKPEVSPTPDGGLFVSIRIDHVRGWLASNDHAMLEVTVSADGQVASAKSSIAIQGRSVTSDLIRGGTEAGQNLVGVDRAVQIGTDLVADISAKMLRERIVEPGRVSFPAALRHNYNHLFQSIRVDPPPPRAALALDAELPEEPPAEEAPARTSPIDIEVNQFGQPQAPQLPPTVGGN